MNAMVKQDAIPSTTPNQLLALAVQQGADLDRLERLMALQERWEANEARKAYVAAMVAFKAEPARITKDKTVRYGTGTNTTEYTHATLGNVVQTVVQGLAKHDLSHSWDTRRAADRVIVSCRITHALGHSECVELEAGLDTSGSKNNIQAMGSTITYLQRYTLLAITGFATEDDDGRGAEPIDDKPHPHQAWFDKITGMVDTTEAASVRAELLEKFHDSASIPKEIAALFNAKNKALKERNK